MVTKKSTKTQKTAAAKNNKEAAPTKKQHKEQAQEALYITRV